MQVTSSVQRIKDAIPSAIATWNSVFGQNNLPKLVTGTGDHVVRVEFNSTPPATGTLYYCGENPNGNLITVYWSTTQKSCGAGGGYNYTTNLSTLIAHELAHSVGFKHLNTINPDLDHCVSALGPNGGLNANLCQGERQVVRFNYGLRQDNVDLDLPFFTSVEINEVQPSVDSGKTRTLTAFVAGEPGKPVASNVVLTWKSSNTNFATVSGNGLTATVTGKKPGTVTITAKVTDPRYETPDVDSAVTQLRINGPPTGLNVTGIAATSGTVRWTNGANNVATVVEYRVSGVTSWETTSPTAAGATSRTLTNLSPATTYQVRAKHVSGTWSTGYSAVVSFTTPALPPPTISGFHVGSCQERTSGGSLNNYFNLVWQASPAQVEGTYQIVMAATNNVSKAKTMLTVPGTQTSGEVGGFLNNSTLTNRWFWIRYNRTGITSTQWVPLSPSPLAVNLCLEW